MAPGRQQVSKVADTVKQLSLVLLLLLPPASGALALQQQPPLFPSVYYNIALPEGSRPEGITAGSGNDLWVACLSGLILHVNLDTDASTVVYYEPGVALSGAKFDQDQQILIAAGSLSGKGYLFHMQKINDQSSNRSQYVVSSKEVVPLCSSPLCYINDVALSNDRVYFTDSFHPQLYSIPRYAAAANSRSSKLASRCDRPVQAHPTGAAFDTKPGQFRANGLTAHSSSSSQDILLVANTHTGNLYSVQVDKPSSSASMSTAAEASVALPGGCLSSTSMLSSSSDSGGSSTDNTDAPANAPANAPAIVATIQSSAIPLLLVQNSKQHQQAGTGYWPQPAVTELALPRVPGKISKQLLLDGVWTVNSTFALAADNYNHRVWGVAVTSDQRSARLACLFQAPLLAVPTTLTAQAGKFWMVNAHLDTCIPFIPCPRHRFEVIGFDINACQPWP